MPSAAYDRAESKDDIDDERNIFALRAEAAIRWRGKNWLNPSTQVFDCEPLMEKDYHPNNQ